MVADPLDTASRPCYEQLALMRRFDFIAELMDHMEALGWEPYQADHEDANGQFELNWKYDDVLATADKHTFFKYMARSIAEKHGLRATFMPKPFAHLTGNGLHAHISLHHADSGANAWACDSGEMGVSAEGYAFLGGILQNAEALCAISNPTVNSYKRINAPVTSSGATWSPNTVSYTGNNRTHMVRIPDAPRFEVRLADGAVNPYLFPAALIACGLHGVEQDVDPGRRCDDNMYTQAPPPGMRTLPLNLLDAVRALEANTVIRDGIGAEAVNAFCKMKHMEWNAHCQHISSFELAATLDC
jgi:glutamine synthetase